MNRRKREKVDDIQFFLGKKAHGHQLCYTTSNSCLGGSDCVGDVLKKKSNQHKVQIIIPTPPQVGLVTTPFKVTDFGRVHHWTHDWEIDCHNEPW